MSHVHQVSKRSFQNHWDPLDKIEIFVEGDRHKAELIPDYETSFRDGDFAEAFCRLQHSYIKLFSIGIEDSPFLRYWEAQKAADLTIVSIDFEPSETLDNDVLDSIVNLLQPRTIDVSFEHCLSQWWEDQTAPYNSKYLGVLARASFVNSLQTCPLNVSLFVVILGFFVATFMRDSHRMFSYGVVLFLLLHSSSTSPATRTTSSSAITLT